MNHRKHLFRKLDPLLILTFVVGVGVILTTTVQARSPNDAAKAPLIDVPAKEPRSWFARVVDNLDSVLSDSGDGLRAGAGGAPVPAQAGFSWHVQALPDESPTANAVQPEVRFGVTYNW
jgi:hypothetical protein